MLRILTILVILQAQAQAGLDRLARPPGRSRREGGSLTIEYVLWAVAVIAIVGIVRFAVKAYVKSQAGNIK